MRHSVGRAGYGHTAARSDGAWAVPAPGVLETRVTPQYVYIFFGSTLKLRLRRAAAAELLGRIQRNRELLASHLDGLAAEGSGSVCGIDLTGQEASALRLAVRTRATELVDGLRRVAC